MLRILVSMLIIMNEKRSHEGSPSHSKAESSMRGGEKPDISEHGANGQVSDQRLYMQLLAFSGAMDSYLLINALKKANIPAVMYQDVNDPTGVALLTMSEDPIFFVTVLRAFLQSGPFGDLVLKPEYTMFGRTYSIGYEPDLQETLLDRPRRYVLDADWPWAIWYPLRRSGEFELLDRQEQMEILKEHGQIGFSFGQNDLAKDIRLACHGMGGEDNDFIIGLLGQELFPLTAIIQRMRKTKQTSQYLEKLGPFFAGKAIYHFCNND